METQTTGRPIKVRFERGQFDIELQAHCFDRIAIMRVALRAIEDGTFETRATAAGDLQRLLPLSYRRLGMDVERIRDAVLHDAFVGVVRALIDHIDRRLAAADFFKGSTPLPSGLSNPEQVLEAIVARLRLQASVVGANKKLGGNRAKLLLLGEFETDAMATFDGLLAARNAIEHHKAIAQKAFTLILYHLEVDPVAFIMSVTESGVSKEGAQASMTWTPSSYEFEEGARIHLTEQQIEDAASTIVTRIAPAIAAAFETQSKSG